MKPVLQGRDLTCHLGRRTILSGISIDLLPGQFHVIIGRNGAGKSTLLKLLCGDITPSAGSIHLWDRPLSAHSPPVLARRRSILAQHTPLAFDYQVLEVVLLGRLPHLGNRAETSHDMDRAHEALRQAGLEGFGNRSYLNLSGGEQQRVHFARILAQLPDEGPPLLFLDEPTSSLDLHHQHKVLGIARDIATRGGSVLAVLHDLNLAARYADHLSLLSGGHLLAHGTPADVLTQEYLETAFEHPVHIGIHPVFGCPLVLPL